ncbi:MAG TPA: HEAT repeat domain-containing protein [Myxococcota bacterium]|nr:HEAT repeat domain-containing protein [Myxococcota bacterium]
MTHGLRASLLACICCLAVAAPGRADNQVFAKKLERALKSTSFKVRLQAAILIGKKKITGAASLLRGVLDDEHDVVRAAAALSLGKLGDEESRGRLAALLAHENKLVAKSAEKSLVLLDRNRESPVYLVVIGRPKLPAGVSRSCGTRLIRVFRSKLERVGGIVLSAGEEKALSDDDLSGHLKRRKLMGILLMPKVTNLTEKVGDGNTTVIGKISIMVATLVRKRMEFNSSGEATAWVEEAPISDEDRVDLQNTVLKSATEAAVQQVIQYLARREENPR